MMKALIGITGGIGSGKSAISNALREVGYHVYDSDSAAKRIIETNDDVRERLTALFGEETYSGGRYNSRYVAQRVFADASLLNGLNEIVHPVVFRDMQEFAMHSKAAVVFAESAILFESGMNRYCDAVIAVSAPLEVRLRRTMLRDNATREQVVKRMQNQMSDEERNQLADLVIINGENNEISSSVLLIQKFICKFAD